MPTTPEQPDFAHAQSFVLCSFQPTKSACSAAAEKCLSGVGQPLSSVSGRQRYNTLDFPKENRVPTGMLLAPIGNPEPKGLHPSGHPHIFFANGTQTVKMQFDTIAQKIQNRCTLHPCENEKYSGFHFAALSDFRKSIVRLCVLSKRIHSIQFFTDAISQIVSDNDYTQLWRSEQVVLNVHSIRLVQSRRSFVEDDVLYLTNETSS